MKISKLFHWCYALLMLLPFLGLIVFTISNFGTGASQDYLYDIYNALPHNLTAVSSTIFNVYSYLMFYIFGLDSYEMINSLICYGLTYWTCVSLIWLIFDVLLYVPLLCHRWLDKGIVE